MTKHTPSPQPDPKPKEKRELLCEVRQRLVAWRDKTIAEAAASQYTSLDHPLGKRHPSKQEVDAYNAGYRDAQEAIKRFFEDPK